ncbi:MAG: hypothetical protein LBB90_06095, partial [Tannerella sp.]|nr:hypothetical protein [Tannerella sp.]
LYLSKFVGKGMKTENHCQYPLCTTNEISVGNGSFSGSFSAKQPISMNICEFSSLLPLAFY